MNTRVLVIDGSSDDVLGDGEVIKTFLDKKTDNAIRVEDEIGAVGVFIADDSVYGVRCQSALRLEYQQAIKET